METSLGNLAALILMILQIDAVSSAENHEPKTDPGSSGHKHHASPHPHVHHPQLLKRRIVCLFNSKYYYKENVTPKIIDPTLCTHVNYEFAILDETTYLLTMGDESLDIGHSFYKDVTDLKLKVPSIKVMLTIGGWNDSKKKYSVLVGHHDKRKKFLDHVIRFLKDHNFDGLDVAWEYPNAWQGNIGIAPEDKENFSLFLQELRSGFDKENLHLSVSVSAIKQEISAAYNISAVSDAVHHINIMVYDLHGPWEHKTGHHARFGPKPTKKDHLNMEDALKIWHEGGADKMKINVGIPAYGKSFTLTDEDQNGLDAPIEGKGKPGPNTKQEGLLAFNEICQYVEFGNWTEKEVDYAGSYAYKGDQWVSYDSPKQIVRKVKFIIDHGFGGVFFKDVACDDYKGNCYQNATFPLLRTIKLEILRRQKADGI